MANKTVVGISILLVALLLVSATAAAYYYNEYQQETQSKNTYVSDLTSETVQYSSLASSYNSSLALDNSTLALLVGTVSAINTSLPAYKQASAALSQLWSRYLSLKPASSSLYEGNFLLDFGNGTRVWSNNTQVQPGWNVYTETVVLTHGELQAIWYPQYQEHLITGIDGVSGSTSMSWFLWTYNATSRWQPAAVGADDLPIYNGSTFAWTYCAESASYSAECTP